MNPNFERRGNGLREEPLEELPEALAEDHEEIMRVRETILDVATLQVLTWPPIGDIGDIWDLGNLGGRRRRRSLRT